MDKKITSKLFIERDTDDNHEIVIRIGPFVDETEALHSASYIYVTQNLDITDSITPGNITIH
jgi:hypothetical protein